MKRLPILIFFVLLTIACRAQTLSVESFKALDNDLTANTAGTMMRDQNGNVAALIRVVTTEKGFVFDGGMMGIVGTKQDVGEILVYVPGGIQKITVKHEQLGILRDYYFPISIEKGRTYEMKLVSGKVRTIVEEVQNTQFLVLKIKPVTASVYIDGNLQQINSEGTVSALVEFGMHDYRVEAAGFLTESGKIEVGSEKTVKEIELESSQAMLTLECSNSEAQIWLNGEDVGTGAWYGFLNPGKYVVEAKLDGHRSRSQTIDLGVQERRTVSLAPPVPILGSLQLNSNPIEAQVFIDGVLAGETPLIMNDVLAGEHAVIIEKKGYHSFETSVRIQEGKTEMVSADLGSIFMARIYSRPKGARLSINGEEVGITPYEKELTAGNYHISMSRIGRDTYDETVHLDMSEPELRVTLKRHLLEPSDLYFSVGFEQLKSHTFTDNLQLSVGAYLKGFNIEAFYRIESDNTAYIYRYENSSSEPDFCIYSSDCRTGGLVGYGILFGNRFRLTPQAGAGICRISDVEGNEHSYVCFAMGGLNISLALFKHVAFSVSSHYCIPATRGELAEAISAISTDGEKWGNGLDATVGLLFYF